MMTSLNGSSLNHSIPHPPPQAPPPITSSGATTTLHHDTPTSISHSQFFGPHAAAAAAAAALSAAYRKQAAAAAVAAASSPPAAAAAAASITPGSTSLLEHSIKSMTNYANAPMLTPSAFAFPNAFPIRELSLAYPHLFAPTSTAAATPLSPFTNPFFNPYTTNSFQSLLASLSTSNAQHGKPPKSPPPLPMDETKLHFPMMMTPTESAFKEVKEMPGDGGRCSPSDEAHLSVDQNSTDESNDDEGKADSKAGTESS